MIGSILFDILIFFSGIVIGIVIHHNFRKSILDKLCKDNVGLGKRNEMLRIAKGVRKIADEYEEKPKTEQVNYIFTQITLVLKGKR